MRATGFRGVRPGTEVVAIDAEGTALVYMRFNATAPDQPAEIWTIGADGSGARRLVTGGYLPTWLP